MTNPYEDLLLSNGEDQPTSAWWSPSSLLSAEGTGITAFTIALISTSGVGSSMLVAQSVLGASTGPSDHRAQNLSLGTKEAWVSAGRGGAEMILDD